MSDKLKEELSKIKIKTPETLAEVEDITNDIEKKLVKTAKKEEEQAAEKTEEEEVIELLTAIKEEGHTIVNEEHEEEKGLSAALLIGVGIAAVVAIGFAFLFFGKDEEKEEIKNPAAADNNSQNFN